MAKREVRWTLRAINDKLAIYKYWNKHNKSTAHSTKLDKLLNEAARLLSNHPYLGPPTDFEDVRVKNLRDYQLFYKVADDSITILAVWDSRQDPQNLDVG